MLSLVIQSSSLASKGHLDALLSSDRLKMQHEQSVNV